MLTNTFVHIQGIGVRTEEKLWESGFTEWNCISPEAMRRFPAKRNGFLQAGIEASLRNLEEHNPAYFGERLPSSLAWRMFPEFRSSIAYVDIETTGLDRLGDEITTIALYDGRSIRTYVQGENLDGFMDDIRDYRVIVSYNGKSFDLPFIERWFGSRLSHAQIDLRWVLKSLGFSGGLKRCERQLGMSRGALEEVDGLLAVFLWDRYRRKRDLNALESLLAYNVQDTINLERLLVTAYNLAIGKTPFAAEKRLPEAVLPENPFRVDPGSVDAAKSSAYHNFSRETEVLELRRPGSGAA
jgi:hypothetical protein